MNSKGNVRPRMPRILNKQGSPWLTVHLTGSGRQQVLQGPKAVLKPVAPLPCTYEPWRTDSDVPDTSGNYVMRFQDFCFLLSTMCGINAPEWSGQFLHRLLHVSEGDTIRS